MGDEEGLEKEATVRYYLVPPAAAVHFASCFQAETRTTFGEATRDGEAYKIPVTFAWRVPNLAEHAKRAVAAGLVVFDAAAPGAGERE